MRRRHEPNWAERSSAPTARQIAGLKDVDISFFDDIKGQPGVIFMTGSEILDWYKDVSGA